MRAKNRPVIEARDAADLERVAADLGPLLPVAQAAALAGRSDQSVRRRLRRRSLACVRVFGLLLVPLREMPSGGVCWTPGQAGQRSDTTE